MRSVAAVLLFTWLSAAGPGGTPASGPVIDNPRVIVWDLTTTGRTPDAGSLRSSDAVLVLVSPASMEGKVIYVSKGTDPIAGMKATAATRAALIVLKDNPVAPLENTSGEPDAFPRPGRIRKVLDNRRVTVWDYTFTRDRAVPMHFHSRDVVTVYLTVGGIAATTKEGEQSSHDFTAGEVRFNPRGRLHTEKLISGQGRIIATELK